MSLIRDLLSGDNPDTQRPVIGEDALDRLRYSSASFDVPRPERVEALPVKPAATDTQQTGTEVERKSGIATSDESPGWYRVTFDEQFAADTKPSVVAVSENRAGEFAEGKFEPPEHDSPESGAPGVVDISIGGISLGDYSVGDQTVSAPSISDFAISPQDISGISISGVSVDEPSVGSIGSLRQISLSGKGVEPKTITHESVIPSFSIEETLKDGSREAGRQGYDIVDSTVDGLFSGIPYTEGLRNDMKSIFDSAFKEIYGAGATDKSGEGFIESVYGAIGEFIDDVIQGEFDTKANEQVQLASIVERRLDDQRADMVNEVNSAITDVDAEVNKLRSSVSTELNALDENVKDAASQVRTNVESSFASYNQQINDNLGQFTEDAASNINTLSQETDEAVSDIVSQYNDQTGNLADEIDSGFTGITQDTNDSLANMRDDVEDQMNTLRDDIENNMLDLRDDTQAGIDEIADAVNAMLADFNSNVQQSYSDLGGLSQEALNQSPRLLYESLGMPEGELMTPVHIRNVDATGFEFLGLRGGMTIHWQASGLTQATEDTDQTEEKEPPSQEEPPEEDDPTPRLPIDTPRLDDAIRGVRGEGGQ